MWAAIRARAATKATRALKATIEAHKTEAQKTEAHQLGVGTHAANLAGLALGTQATVPPATAETAETAETPETPATDIKATTCTSTLATPPTAKRTAETPSPKAKAALHAMPARALTLKAALRRPQRQTSKSAKPRHARKNLAARASTAYSPSASNGSWLSTA